MTCIVVPFKKSFVGNSLNGQVFYWLKSVYGEALSETVDESVRLIYGPSALAASSTTWNEVKAEVAYCRAEFEEKMALAACAPPPTLPIPNRINVQFGASLESSLPVLNAFEWLCLTYKKRAVAVAVQSVHLVYLPAVLGSSAESREQAPLQVERSRIFFEQQMRNAIRASTHDAESMAHRLEQVFQASPDETSGVDPPALTTDSLENDPVQEDFGNDFVPVNTDIDF